MPKLNARKIYEKSFSTSLKGYNPTEVDAFLDVILEDYQDFTKKIYKLESELELLRNEIQKNQFRSKNEDNEFIQPQPKTNLDLLQRVANLEKAVFGKKED